MPTSLTKVLKNNKLIIIKIGFGGKILEIAIRFVGRKVKRPLA
jgi:hypothetical protein